MNAATRRAQRESYRAAVKALDGVTGVMVRRNAYRPEQEDAGTLVAIKTHVAVVKLASGPNSGRTRDYPADWVRPAAPFEVIT